MPKFNTYFFFFIILDFNTSITFTDNNKKNDKVEIEKNNCDFKDTTDLPTTDGTFN